jgi:hypothetical protein
MKIEILIFCGIIGAIHAQTKNQLRVVNGTDAKIEEFPFLVCANKIKIENFQEYLIEIFSGIAT